MNATQTYTTLSYRATVELLRRLNGGTVGFDYGPFKIAELRAMIAEAISEGRYDAEQVETVAADVAAAAATPAQPFAASATPAPKAARALPKIGRPAPAPLGVVPEIEPTPVAPAPSVHEQPAMPEPAPQPVAPVAQPVAPVAPSMPEPMPEPAPQPAESPQPAPDVQPMPEPAPQPAKGRKGAANVADPDAPARMPLSQAFPRVKLPALRVSDCPVYGHPDAPAVDPHYIFDADALAVALAGAESGLNMWLYGPPGTGKTEFVRQFAARTGRPFFRIQFDRNIERAEFLGSIALRDGNTVWADGIMLQAYRTPGAVILLDEICYAQQGNIAVLNGMLEATREFRITETGDKVTAANDVLIFACDNTNGTGDASGLFLGTAPLNVATANRFGAFIRFDFLGRTSEAKVLRDRTGISKDGADAIAGLLHVCRQKAEAGAIASAPTLREAVAMSELMRGGISAPAAFETCVASRAIPESQEELRNLFSSHWPSTLAAPFAAFVVPAAGVQS